MIRMADTPKATTDKGVKSLLSKGVKNDHSAGNGLYLKVSGKGSGSWYFRYKVAGKVKRIGLGAANVVTLKSAKKKAQEQRVLIDKGIDPQEHRESLERQKKAAVITFDMVAADYIATQRESWTNTKHAQQWTNTIATYASPVIGHLPPAEITTEHILELLTPIWNTKKETARRVRNRVELILNAAKARKLREGENVAAWRGHLELLLTKNKTDDRRHQPALPWPQVGQFFVALNNDLGIGAQALQLTILTALRTSEILGAHWSEFDLIAGVWTVPAERMKAKKEHRVPLSTAVLELLNAIPRASSGLLFEGQKEGRPVSNMAMLMKIRRMDTAKHSKDGIGWRDDKDQTITAHGFRSTFRDWAAENTAFANIVVEQALAHSIGSAVEKAYRRGDLLERRRELMQAWADYVTRKQVSNVVSIHREA